jgi:hypothetical protein
VADIDFGLLPADNADGSYNGAEVSAPANQNNQSGFISGVQNLLGAVSAFKPPVVKTQVSVNKSQMNIFYIALAAIATLFIFKKK